ncbi:uncharacterized protein EDB93DRAFT_220326 [Suillus bovinus]|uniref:uncharacterized protein n=1 Tax=Suillus bovinus TaxID=48563 RepID=UPI001B8752B9|nr:uncharacterized protein EDB93DRAFT_220326 [Suillus bovinus]KAG2153505.1 hypothetical protein EDB93DRAFT_220326 [Suillus bovinus]
MIRHHNSPFRQLISPNYYGCGRTRWGLSSNNRNNGTFTYNRTLGYLLIEESIVEVRCIANMAPFQRPNLNKVEFCPPIGVNPNLSALFVLLVCCIVAYPYPLCSVVWQPRVCRYPWTPQPDLKIPALLKQSLSLATAVHLSYKIHFVRQFSPASILNNLALSCHTLFPLQTPTLPTGADILRPLRTIRLSRFPCPVAGTRSRLHRRRKVDSSLLLSVPCNRLDKQCSIVRTVVKFSHPALISPPISLDVA